MNGEVITYKFPTRMYLGRGIVDPSDLFHEGGLLSNILKEYDEFNEANVIILTDRHSYKLLGEDALLKYKSGRMVVSVLAGGDIEEFVVMKQLESIIKIFDTEGTGYFIVGFGKAFVLDTAKYFSKFLLDNRLVLIPSIPSTDACATGMILEKDVVVRCNPAHSIIIDTDILEKSPLILLKSGILEALSSIIEGKDVLRNSECITLTHLRPSLLFNRDILNSIEENLVFSATNALLYAKDSKRNEVYYPSYKRVLEIILGLSGIIHENIGISFPHIFSLACEEELKQHDIRVPHGQVVGLGILIEKYLNIFGKYDVKYRRSVDSVLRNCIETEYAHNIIARCDMRNIYNQMYNNYMMRPNYGEISYEKFSKAAREALRYLNKTIK